MAEKKFFTYASTLGKYVGNVRTGRKWGVSEPNISGRRGRLSRWYLVGAFPYKGKERKGRKAVFQTDPIKDLRGDLDA